MDHRPLAITLLLALALAPIGCTTDNDFLDPGDPTILDDLEPVDSPSARLDPALWGTVVIQWFEAPPNRHDLKVVAYHVATNPAGGDINAANWNGMTLLGVRGPSMSRVHAAVFDDRSGILPGTTMSFAVRPLYEGGFWGPVGPVMSLTPTLPHTQGGTVRDDLGRPLSGITVRLLGYDDHEDPRGFTSSATTDAQGRFVPLGPIGHTAALVIETDSPDVLSAPAAEDAWYDYRTGPLDYQADPGDLELCLVTKYGFDPIADGIQEWNNLEFLQHLSFSRDNLYGTTFNHTYRTWASYPLKVYIPEATSHDGVVDFDEQIRAGMEFWNTTLERELFVETHQPDLAQITCYYDDPQASGLFRGSMEFVPQVLNENWGISVPIRARFYLNPDMLVVPEHTQRTVRHELVHALGWYDHSWDTAAMMSLSAPSLTPMDYEIRLLKTLLGLPNLVEMNRYEESFPDHLVY